MKFLWLDDDPERILTELKYQIEDLGECSVSLTVIPLDGKDVHASVSEILKMTPRPDLVIIDHHLNRVSDESIMRHGSSIAATIRGSWHDVPIVGISAKFNTRQEKLARVFEHEYIEFFDFTSISRDLGSFWAICCGFKGLHSALNVDTENLAGWSPIEAIIDSVGCPDTDRELLKSIMPMEFKEKGQIPDLHFLSRWIWHQLTELPGLLYDEKYSSVLLGVNDRGFSKIAQEFDVAKYKGVFASDDRPRWWSSELKAHLLTKVPEPRFAQPWQRGRLLSGITSEDYSVSHFSGDPEPDTLALADEFSFDLYPERSRFTIIHPAETLAVGFEPRRIFNRIPG